MSTTSTPTPQQGKNWCFTCNNYTEEDQSRLRQLGWSTLVRYVVFGREVGEEGTPHLQGLIVFVNNKRTAAVRRMLPGCHVEKAKGTAYEAMIYCQKDEDFEEYGVAPEESYTRSGGATTKKNWEEAWESAKAGRLDDIPKDMLIRYYSTFNRIKKDYMVAPEALVAPCGLWIYGSTGTGKSHSVHTQHPNRYIKPLNKWWDGYRGQDIVHIDELDPTHSVWIAPFLKLWSDKWPFAAEVKGGALQIRPKLVVITSNYTMEQMGFKDGDIPALARRFRQVQKFRDQDIIVQ